MSSLIFYINWKGFCNILWDLDKKPTIYFQNMVHDGILLDLKMLWCMLCVYFLRTLPVAFMHTKVAKITSSVETWTGLIARVTEFFIFLQGSNSLKPLPLSLVKIILATCLKNIFELRIWTMKVTICVHSMMNSCKKINLSWYDHFNMHEC